MSKVAFIAVSCCLLCSPAQAEENTLSTEALLGSKAANTVLSGMSDADIIDADFEKIVEGFRKTLINKKTIAHQELLAKENSASVETRRMDEIYYLKSNKLYPFYQHSDRGYFYLPIAAPTSGSTKKATLSDSVKIRLSAKTHEDIVYHDDPTPISQAITDFPKSLGLSMVGMPEGATWQILLPSWTMFGSKKYMNIPPYSTLLVEVEMLEVIKSEAGNKDAEDHPTALENTP